MARVSGEGVGKKGRKRLQTNPGILKTTHTARHAWVRVPPPSFIFCLSFHFSRGQNRESRSSIFLCSETARKRLLRRLVSLQSLPILRYITYHRTPHIHCQKYSFADQQVCRFSCRKKIIGNSSEKLGKLKMQFSNVARGLFQGYRCITGSCSFRSVSEGVNYLSGCHSTGVLLSFKRHKSGG